MEQTIRRYRSDWDLARCGQLENGIYRSRWYPGLRPGMEWLRLSLAVSGPVYVRVYAADDPSPAPSMRWNRLWGAPRPIYCSTV